MTKKETSKPPRTCKKCGKPITGPASYVATGEHTAAGPYHAACKPK